jgi:tetratricopeptide (TPR) repeat protein
VWSVALLNVSSRAFEANAKGERLVADGKLDEALAAFSEAVLASPGYVSAWLNRAHVLDKLGRIDEAEADREAARSVTATVRSAAQAPASQWTAPASPRTQYEYRSEDVVGARTVHLELLPGGPAGAGDHLLLA